MFIPLSGFVVCFAASEKKGNAPKSCEGNQGVDDSGDDGLLAAADPCYEVELEKSDAAPVECADDNEYEGESVKYHSYILSEILSNHCPILSFPERR